MSTGHKAEAERLVDFEQAVSQETADKARAASSAAQVHATLYLAEQQRIANLIALGETNVIDPGDDSLYPVTKMRDDIRKGLGL